MLLQCSFTDQTLAISFRENRVVGEEKQSQFQFRVNDEPENLSSTPYNIYLSSLESKC